MNQNFKNSRLLIFACGFLLVCVSAAMSRSMVRALEGEDVPSNTQPKMVSEERKKPATTKPELKKNLSGLRLDGDRLKICTARKNVIFRLHSKLTQGRENKIKTIEAISQRVQTYYQDNKLSVSNYDSLLAAVNSNKAAAQAALQTLKDSYRAFDCQGEDPKGKIQAFRENLKKLDDSVRAYKSSVKELVRAVKAANQGAQQ